jgi:hypothetical protein
MNPKLGGLDEIAFVAKAENFSARKGFGHQHHLRLLPSTSPNQKA